MSETSSTLPAEKSIYAGFWRRSFALLIDYNIILLIALAYVIVSGSLGLGDYRVDSPFGLWTTERVVENNSTEETLEDGSIIKYETEVTEETHFGNWVYTYQENKTIIGDDTESDEFELINGSRSDISRTDKDDITFFLLFLYLIAFEASKLQASPGKILLKIKVVSAQGGKVTISKAIGRNLAKILSWLTLCIGFFMAGWTQRKQALHDKLAGCCIVKENIQAVALENEEINSNDKSTKSILLILAIVLIGIPMIGILLAIMLPMVMQ